MNPADTVSPLHMNLQVVNFQRCKCALTRPVTLAHASGVHCHCMHRLQVLVYFAYGSVYSTVVDEYFYFKSKMSRSKCKSSGYVAGTSKKCQAMERKVKIFERV